MKVVGVVAPIAVVGGIGPFFGKKWQSHLAKSCTSEPLRGKLVPSVALLPKSEYLHSVNKDQTWCRGALEGGVRDVVVPREVFFSLLGHGVFHTPLRAGTENGEGGSANSCPRHTWPHAQTKKDLNMSRDDTVWSFKKGTFAPTTFFFFFFLSMLDNTPPPELKTMLLLLPSWFLLYSPRLLRNRRIKTIRITCQKVIQETLRPVFRLVGLLILDEPWCLLLFGRVAWLLVLVVAVAGR